MIHFRNAFSYRIYKSYSSSKALFSGITPNLILSLFLATFLCACATRPPLAQQANISEYKKPGMALIVGSLVIEKGLLGYDNWKMSLRSTEPSNSFQSEIQGSRNRQLMGAGNDFDFGTKKHAGNMFALVVPAGNYEFYNYFLYKNNGMSYSTWRPKSEFSAPFKVEENKINYIGELAIHTGSAENLLGISITSFGVWSIGDAKHRDIHLLRSLYPSLQWDSLVTSIPTNSTQPEVVIVNENNKHVLATTSLPTPEELEGIIRDIHHGNFERKRAIARQVVSDYWYQETILDALQEEVKLNYQLNNDDRLWIDSVAWMCRALATSKNKKYKPFVTEVSKNATSKKLRGYASKYLTYF